MSILEGNGRRKDVPRPMHTSHYTGHVRIHEVLQGHEKRSYTVFNRTMFVCLRDELLNRGLIRDYRSMTANEQLAIFLHAMGHGEASGAMCECFEYSSQTISHYVNLVVRGVATLRNDYIRLPTVADEVHPRIRHDSRFYPFFKDAVGAIEGTHIHANVLQSKHSSYRNRKGEATQNVMATVEFDLQFQYLGMNWKGATADMFIFNWTLDQGGFSVPTGKYYVVDLQYVNIDHFLAPFRGELYYIQQYQGRGNASYWSPEDKFNHRHAQLRNVIERAFGTMKMRFKTLKKGNMYSF